RRRDGQGPGLSPGHDSVARLQAQIDERRAGPRAPGECTGDSGSDSRTKSEVGLAVLLSMTGFGEARLQDERWSVEVEVRTVTTRHLKLSAKISEPYGALEPELERLVRETIRRGSVQLVLRVERPRRAEDYRLNLVALASYHDQVRELLPA